MTTIFYEDIPVADIAAAGPLTLTYHAAWEAQAAAFPVSLSMPLGASPFAAEITVPWLANLLPEAHLSEIGQRLKVAPQDVIGLLERIGRDTAGAFSIGQARAAGTRLQPIPNAGALERIINELPEKPFLAGEHGVSMSLAGVQDKLPVHVGTDGRMSIPLEGTPSTHILKPDAPRLAGSVENEAFCLALARACGLDSARAGISAAGNRRYLLVERYDRLRDAKGIVRRLHQEDFCQITGHLPARKYERSGQGAGVTLKAMFDAMGDLVSPGERLNLLDAVIFNVLICNSDSHAKNYSILIGAGGSAKMAPLYDLTCAAVYPNVDQTLPQQIGGKFVAADLHAKDWAAFARDVRLSAASSLRRVEQLAERVSEKVGDTVDKIAEAAPHDIVERISHEIRKRCRRILRQLK